MNPISPHVPATFRQFPHLGLRGVLLLLGLAAAVLPAACTSGGDGSVTGDHGSTVALSAPIEPGETCAYGGYQIDYGVDKNGNGTLDPDEIAGTAVLCNGAEGAAGTPGNDGTPGQDGKDGTPGTPGADGRDATAIVYRFTRTSANASCVQGGTRIDLGRDDGLPAGTASNGVLEDGEIERTDWLCANGSGVSEGTVALPVPVAIRSESPEVCGFQSANPTRQSGLRQSFAA